MPKIISHQFSSQPTMLLYKCTSCQEVIQCTKARLTCSTCSPPLTLCTNCYVVQDYPPQHPDSASHSISVYQHSGYLPVPPSPTFSTSTNPVCRRYVSSRTCPSTTKACSCCSRYRSAAQGASSLDQAARNRTWTRFW